MLAGALALTLTVLLIPSPAQAGHVVWSATLTATDVFDSSPGSYFGCSNFGSGWTTVQCSLENVLTDDDFSYDGVTYEITYIGWNQAGRELEMALTDGVTIPDSLKNALVLHVGGRQFAWADGSFVSSRGTNDQILWSGASLGGFTGLTDGATVKVQLTDSTVLHPEPSEVHLPYLPTIRAEDVRTRADAVLYALESNRIGCPPRDRHHVAFSDVPRDHPRSFAVGCAAYHGIVLGYGDGTFRPDEPVSPEHLSIIRRRASDWTSSLQVDTGTA